MCVVIVMGVSGAGKSTLGAALAAALGWDFQEGDALHPAANVARMHAGVALTDAERGPWLDRIAAWIDGELRTGRSGLVTCSALKRAYRDRLVAGRDAVRLLYLEVPEAVLAARMAARRGHFMPAALLGSQLATLERPDPDERPVIVSAEADPMATRDRALAALAASGVIRAVPASASLGDLPR